MAFELAHNFSSCHLIPQSSDLLLHPPEAYLFIQDFLIISCGILYALCYAFYMTRTYSDRYCAGTPLYLAGTMAYEVYYAVVTTTTRFERFAFFAWFLLDAAFACVAIGRAYPRAVRGAMASWLVAGVLGGVGMLRVLGWYWPDEREQVTAYWTGLALQLPIGWGSVVLLMKRGDTKGQSLEIWITRLMGCLTAYGVFFWRYWNVPQNWAYVGSSWSIWTIMLTLLPEVVYPFVYIWAHHKERGKGKRD